MIEEIQWQTQHIVWFVYLNLYSFHWFTEFDLKSKRLSQRHSNNLKQIKSMIKYWQKQSNKKQIKMQIKKSLDIFLFLYCLVNKDVVWLIYLVYRIKSQSLISLTNSCFSSFIILRFWDGFVFGDLIWIIDVILFLELHRV